VEDHSPATQRTSFFAVKKFLTVNLPRFQFYWQSVELPSVRKTEPDRIPSKSELVRILNHADLKDRVIVSLAVSSGIRESGLAGLKVRDVDLVSYPDVGAISVPAELNKAKFAYLSFITPQARGFLEKYLQTRKNQGKPADPESPLILNQQ
jgi:integrase